MSLPSAETWWHAQRPSWQLRVGLLCGLAGLWLGASLPPQLSLWALACVITLWVSVSLRWWLGSVFIVLTFGGLWAQLSQQWHQLTPQLPLSSTDQPVTMVGTIVRFPDVRPTTTRYHLALSTHGTTPTTDQILLVSSQPSPQWDYGTTLQFTGTRHPPRNFGQFDYRAYLARQGISALVTDPTDITIIGQEGGSGFIRTAKRLRNHLKATIRTHVPDPHALIAVGVLLGERESLPAFTQSTFQRAGLQHLLVVSGFNVTLVFLCVGYALQWLGPRVMLGGSLLSLFAYVALTGGDGPILRAALMGGISGYSLLIGRYADGRTLLLLSLFLIGLWHPALLRHDVGLQLSALATLGLLVFTPPLESLLTPLPSPHPSFTRLLSASLAAQLSVMPLLITHFGQVSWVGLIANLLADPLVPLVMATSTLSSLVGALPVLGPLSGAATTTSIELLLWAAALTGWVDPVILPAWFGAFSLGLVCLALLWGTLSDSSHIHLAKNKS